MVYHWSTKGWIASAILELVVDELNHQMRRKSRKIVLLMDQAGPHKPLKQSFSHVQVVFLPPNTSYLQPLDAGIIRSFKAHYRKNLVHVLCCCAVLLCCCAVVLLCCCCCVDICAQFIQHIFHTVELKTSPNIDIKVVMNLTNKAWNAVTAETIQKCWLTKNFPSSAQAQLTGNA